MPALLLLLYLAVEIAAVVALAHVVGVLWTLVILVAVWALGLRLVKTQGRRTLTGLRAGSHTVADGAVVAVGSLLVLLPGLVTSLLGASLLLPPTRALLRPLAVLLASRRLGVVGAATTVFARGHGEVIDGEVVDAHYDDEQPRPEYGVDRPGYGVDRPGYGIDHRR
jgi:UPF0716 protein FxsA